MSAPTTRAVLLHREGPTCWLQLNRSASMNSLSTEVLDGLEAAMSTLRTDTSIRVAVVTGTGDAFCAGADLKGLLGVDRTVRRDHVLSYVDRAAELVDALAALPIPTIAAVNGIALAGGLELVLACDIVIAAASARLGDGHAVYGLMPGAGGAARLTAALGPSLAKYLMLTGLALPAADLKPCGLVHEVVPDEQLRRRVSELAEGLAARSATGLRGMKELIAACVDVTIAEGLELEQQALAAQANTSDFEEGLEAFSAKRSPRFAER